jgi:hypothetical protein
MGLSIVISGAIIFVALMFTLMNIPNVFDSILSVEEASSEISSLENSILQTDMKISSIAASSGFNDVTFILTNTGAEKLWNFDTFDIFVTYDADILGTPTRITEQFTYNASAAFGVGFGSQSGITFERPDSEQSGGWQFTTNCASSTPENCINEIIQSDAEFISTKNLGQNDNDIVEFSLSDVSNPGIDTGHIVRYTYREGLDQTNDPSLDVRLLQGVTEISAWNHAAPLPTVFTLASQTLTTIQASTITDYTDLRLEFTAICDGTCINPGPDRDNVEVSWAELEVPLIAVSSSQWTVNSISNDILDPQILNEQETAEINVILSYPIYSNSNLSVIISSDNGIVATKSKSVL